MVVSEEITNFTLSNQQGEEVNFYEALSNTVKGMVIFVYPKANTPGCTKQAIGFRDHYEEIKECGYDVFGLSKDKQSAQASWKKSKNLPYDLLSDEDGEVLSKLGCLSGTTTSRSVFVVDRETRVLLLERVKISPEESVSAVLHLVKGAAESDREDEDGGSKSSDDEKEGVTDEAKAAATKPVSKGRPKAKAKTGANRSRPPLEKKPVEDIATEKQVSTTKRTVAPRAPSVDDEKKRPTRSVTKKSVKRSEPTGGVDPEADGSPKGTKRSKKTPASDVEEDAVSKSRSGSQPPIQRPARVTRKGTAEKAKSEAANREASKEDPKTNARKKGTTTRTTSATPSKGGRKKAAA